MYLNRRLTYCARPTIKIAGVLFPRSPKTSFPTCPATEIWGPIFQNNALSFYCSLLEDIPVRWGKWGIVEYPYSARGWLWIVSASPPSPEPQTIATRGLCKEAGSRCFKNEAASFACSNTDRFFGNSVILDIDYKPGGSNFMKGKYSKLGRVKSKPWLEDSNHYQCLKCTSSGIKAPRRWIHRCRSKKFLQATTGKLRNCRVLSTGLLCSLHYVLLFDITSSVQCD